MKQLSLLILIVLIFSSCGSNSLSNEQDYLRWINDENNGLIQKKIVGEYELSVKYVPTEYLVYRELKNKEYTQSSIDSLKKHYQHAMTFLLTISPSDKANKKSEGDVMYNDVTSLEDYQFKTHEMNFEMQDYVKMIADGKTYNPVLSAMENIYSLGNQRSISLVFTEEKGNELLEAKDYDFVYQDEIFGTGITHFQFTQKDIKALPLITFWQPIQ